MTLDVWRPPGMAFALALPLWVGLSANSAVWLINTISLLVSVMALLYLVAGSGIRKPTAVVLAVVMPPIAAVYMPVSYTHLDVYKRQGMAFGREANFLSLESDASSLSPELNAFDPFGRGTEPE